MNTPQRPLRINGIFSILSGALLGLAPGSVETWLGLEATALIQIFGGLLVAHGIMLLWAAQKENPYPLTTLNVIAIAPYPAITVGLVLSGIVTTNLGRAIVLVDGSIIAVLAVWQWRSVRGQRRPETQMAL